MKTHTSTIKEMASLLGISQSKAFQIKAKIESEYDAPSFMVWGTGHNKRYSVKSFKKYL